ncbi:MAG: sigma-54-dependent Fis family transcriptional regulator [Deltaproteobacteria bacterium]|nr:sigma-54-dependent Fis family transcriptional regulator [Deltaproteobacteria bacterium]RLB90409.1 MAG: two-component system response regulator [Deltaproteobacteria bacterium]
MKKLDIMVVEDGESQRVMLRDFLVKKGHSVSEAENGDQAIRQIRNSYFDLVFLDYKMPGKNGLEILREIKRMNPEIDIVMMTAYGTIETAVEAMKAGAVDYITKPIDLEEVLILIERISERRTLVRENEIMREQLRRKGVSPDNIIYRSPAMDALVNMAARVASSRAAVLLQGETGTGKELFAGLIHNLSPRSNRPMITVNCAALPETLLESELFGHEKGAFTGAERRRIGRFEEADGGTLFLDEVGELPPLVQVKLLRFVHQKEFQRLGGNRTIRADVRIISATNKDLKAKVKEGSFREDLYYRLNVVAMVIPPLRKRKEDIPLLIDHFLRHFSLENGKEIKGISREAKDLLLKYDYPGNVRELENIIERAVVISRDPIISREDLPFTESTRRGQEQDKERRSLKESIETMERQLIEQAMKEAEDHQTKAAGILGLSERMLRYKLKKYGLK